jgi:hypothetical protein
MAPAAQAGTTSLQGDFRLDNDLAIFAFDLATAGDIVATTTSHASGGFAPVLTLFDAGGYLAQGNVGSSNGCLLATESFCWDAGFTFTGAAAGHYTLVLSQDDNNYNAADPVTVPAMSSFYSRSGEPHYTSANLGLPDDDTVHFVRVDGNQRSGHWALDVTAASAVTQVPEPAAMLLWATGLAGLAALRHRRSI